MRAVFVQLQCTPGKTYEVADAIYGVSMGRDGVSKVLSLRLADIPQN